MLKFFIFLHYRSMHYFAILLVLSKINWSVQLNEICANGPKECLIVSEKEEELLKQPFYIDPNGFKINWTDPQDGWNLASRLMQIKLQRRYEYQRKVMPKFTELGYIKMKIPPRVFEVILEEKLDHLEPEGCDDKSGTGISINCRRVDPENGQYILNNNNFIFNFGSKLIVERVLKYQLKPILAQWANVTLGDPMVMYGIRRYTRGARLWGHVDRIPTHIISAILQIDQKVDEDWPLYFLDHHNVQCKILLKPGEMLLYESAIAPHGRQDPLKEITLITCLFTLL